MPLNLFGPTQATPAPAPRPSYFPQAQLAPAAAAPEPGFAQRWLGQGTLVGTLGDSLSRGGYAVRNLLAGKPGAALAGLPGSAAGMLDVMTLNAPRTFFGKGAQEYTDELTGFGPEDRTSTQDLLKKLGVLDRADHGFFRKDSWTPDPAFAAGLAGDIASDPLSWTTGGLNRAGGAARIVSGTNKYADDLASATARAQAGGDAFKINQLNRLKATAPARATGAGLGATKAEQAALGQRDFLRFGGRLQLFPGTPTLDLPEIPLIRGEGLYRAGEKISELASRAPGAQALKSMFAHGSVQKASAMADSVKKSTEEDFLRARELMKQADAGDQAAQKSLDEFFANRGVAGTGTNAQKAEQLNETLKKTEDYWGHNVGSNFFQQDQHGKEILRNLMKPENRPQAAQIVDDLNAALGAKAMAKGQKPARVLGDLAHTNAMDRAIDEAYRAGLSHREINDVFKARTGYGLVSEELANQLQMRGAQHGVARSRAEFADSLVRDKVAQAYTGPVNKLSQEFGNDVQSFAGPRGNKYYVVPRLGYSKNEQLVFNNLEDAVAAHKAYDNLITPGETGVLNKGLKVWDKANAWQKQFVTRIFPQFHAQNHLSNRLQSYLEDVPVYGKHYNMANDLMAGKDIGAIQLPDGTTVNGAQLLDEYKSLNQGMAGQFDEVAGDLPRLGQEHDGKLKKLFGRGMDVAERAAATPAALGQLFRNPKMTGKLTGQSIESADRLGHYLYKRVIEGLPPNEALSSVEKALFNYSPAAMTNFEREAARRAVLFYGYPRSALPFVAGKLAENPGKIGNLMKLGAQPGRPENTPEYLRDQGTLGLGTDNSTLSNLPSPVEAALKPFEGFNDERSGRGIESLLGLTSPLIKAPYMLASGRDPFTGREVSNKAPNWLPDSLATLRQNKAGEQRREVNPLLNILLGNTPTSRLGTTANSLLKPETTLGDFALNTLTSTRVNRFEPEIERVYQQINNEQKTLDQFAKQGFLVKTQFGYTVEPAARGKVPSTATRALRRYNSLRQQARTLKLTKVKRKAISTQ
jgi:hypothetical protein